MLKVIIAIAAVGVPSLATAGDWSVSNASSLSSGRYGGPEATRVASSSLALSRGLAGWQVSATLPYLNIESGGGSTVAGGVVLDRGAGRKRQSGYGDVQFRIDRPISFGPGSPVDMRVSANIKAPTGARRFSTGKFDGGVSVEVSRTIAGVTPYVTAGYRMFGDSAGLRLANGWTSSAGATMTRGPLTVMASYERSNATYGGPAPRELFGLASYAVAPGLNWTVYGTKGLNAGSANLMVGTALTRQIF